MPAQKSPAEKGSSQLRPYEELMRQVQGRATLDGSASFDIAANVIDQIAAAETLDDIFAANEAGPADMADYLGVNLNITDARFHTSAEKFRSGTLGVYVVLEGHDDNGKEFLVSTGAPNVVSSVYRAQVTGNLSVEKPLRCMIRGRETANGTLYTLARPM